MVVVWCVGPRGTINNSEPGRQYSAGRWQAGGSRGRAAKQEAHRQSGYRAGMAGRQAAKAGRWQAGMAGSAMAVNHAGGRGGQACGAVDSMLAWQLLV